MKRVLGIWLAKACSLLPRDLDARARWGLVVTLPVIIYKALKRICFGRRAGVQRLPPEARCFARSMERRFPPGEIPSGGLDQEIAIRYSGGDDSTLTAALMASGFERVHLLTFTTDCQLKLLGLINSDPLNTMVNVKNLSRRYGQPKFQHEIIRFGQLRNAIYFGDFLPACGDDLFYHFCFCLPCSMAMHIETIIYCLKHGIRYASDGSNVESGFMHWQSQNPFSLNEVREFYGLFRIEYIVNPCYYSGEADAELNRLQVHSVRNSKRNYVHRRRTQQFCTLIQLQSLFRRLYGSPRDPQASSFPQAGMLTRFFQHQVPKYQRYILSRAGQGSAGIAAI